MILRPKVFERNILIQKLVFSHKSVTSVRLLDPPSLITHQDMTRGKKEAFDAVQRYIEANGYKYGHLVQVYKNENMANKSEESKEREEPILFCREAIPCGTAVEAQYNASKDNQGKGKRTHTKHIYCHCYTDRNLAKIKEVEERGRNQLNEPNEKRKLKKG